MANTKSRPSLILGLGLVSKDPSNVERHRELVAAAKELNIKVIDTSRVYGGGSSEEFIGKEGLSSEFDIVTKARMGLIPGGASKEGILQSWKESEEALKVKKVKYYLLHVPNDTTPIGETLEGIQALYLAGHFEQFGLSNFTPTQVEECHTYMSTHSYTLPTVYQSIYSLSARLNQTTLFPLLRTLNISIQSYSCLGSGFLVRTPAQIRAGEGNFNRGTVLGKILQSMYGGERYLEFLERFGALVEEMGVGETRVGVAYRWVVWHGGLDGEKGDQVVVGASSAKQLRETVKEIEKGPLEEWVIRRLDEMWKDVEDEAPENNFVTFAKLVKAGELSGATH
ncbi:NADP-dependent oxidoreductase domain-containing protein [Cadophora sp. MPI-SDFR-AT-0126]|nr:NADP-dependent oxidoreductase domain-containing protein [Leotiomycetes sp. MPI-SDFR-AT-0126]